MEIRGDKRLNLFVLLVLLFVGVAFFSEFVLANTYIDDVYFTVPDTVFMTNESIGIKGYLYQANYSGNGTLVSSSSAVPSATVNVSILRSNRTLYQNYSFTTDSSGSFYSKSNFYPGAKNITSPLVSGTFIIRADYTNLNGNVSFSEVEIYVSNQTLDLLGISSDRAVYNPSESMRLELSAFKLVGDKTLYVANVSLNGSLRNSTKDSLQTFSCTTGNNGKCTAGLTSPSSYGDYFLEISNFKAFSSFSVVPFSYNLYMKDDTNGLKNIFALGEKGKVEVKINNASSSDSYTFSGYIADSAGNSVKSIDSTVLNSNNAFTNSFQFTVDAVTFSYGTYSAHITVSKSGDGSISSIASFQVQDWMLSVDKKSTSSGFEYEYSTFPSKVLRFEALPTYRANGSVIPNITSSSFNVSLKDNLNNVFASTSASWNSSCGKSGCYEISLTAPSNIGKYSLYSTLSYSGDSQTDTRPVNVISGVMSAQSTDKDGNLKELFGANEYVYFSLSAYNQTSSSFNLSDAEVLVVSYMNGSEYSYSQVNYSLVNASNSNYEWAWNSSQQRIKIDVPKSGGTYSVFLFGNNKTMGATAKFIINPYDVCTSAKNTPGTVSSGYYYVWQFKTTDTVYFEIKLTQANNPLGKATAFNGTGNSSSYGMGSACAVDTTTKQVVSNATISISEVKSLESGAIQSLNSSESSCQASDTSGGYTCTVKPLSKWDGGVNIVKFNVIGQDGTSSVFYNSFESRAFYLYGWSTTWQNNPDSNIAISLRLYEAGNNWWGSSSGKSGTVTVKRVEYQGRDGEWLWPPVDSGYNATNISSVTITSGSGSLTLPAYLAPSGGWKTGYYRAVLQATTTSGDTDYGYAWFGVKLWDVYGQPVECTTFSCNYKSYFNSKDNITLYVTINKAGASWWNSNTGGADIYGNVSVGIKKIQDCKTWPCKELNSSQYTAGSILVNSSSPGYWYANSSQNNYMIQINKTSGSWNTGYYSVVLNVNGTDTGYAWFNTIAFYVEAQPTNATGTGYKYSIRGSQPMYFNVTTTKSYKGQSSYYNGSTTIYSRYNETDYINTTVSGAVLRTWDQQTYRSKELNYLTDFNVTPSSVNGSALVRVDYNNGSWPTGYYYGELSLKNSDNETSTGWLWFSVQPFRVGISSSSYSIDSDQCINSSLSIYDSDWSSSTPLDGNYSIVNVYEDIWSGSSSSRTSYGNYTINGLSNTSTFNSTANNVTFCPNNGGQWGSGSWGGYHYLNVIVRDNLANDTQTGWLSFRTVPFQVTWSPSSLSSVLTTANVNTVVLLTKSSGGNASGNLTKLYQWRYDNSQSTREEYTFTVNSSGVICNSAVSGQCTVNASANVTINAPSGGWKVGYNYIQSEWTKQTDSSSIIQDWSGIYFDGRESYNGYFNNVDSNGNWRYYFAPDENITIRLYLRDYNNDYLSGSTVSSVQYALADNCGSESCLSYTSATFNSPLTTASGGIANINMKKSDGTNWTRGDYKIRARVGSTYITGGSVRVKGMTPPNITSINVVNNATYNLSLGLSAVTSKTATCSFYMVNHGNFYNWYCSGWNSTSSNSTNWSAQSYGACNITKYNYTGTTYRTQWISNNYNSYYDGSNNSYCSSSSNSLYCYGPDYSRTMVYASTGGTTHTYTLNLTGLPEQHYGLQVSCYDEDYNYANVLSAFKVNNTI